MSSQFGLGAASGALAPPSIRVKPIAKGDTFPSVDGFRTAFETNMIRDGRHSKADKRVSGGKAKLYPCTGVVVEEDCRCCGETPEGRPKKKCKKTFRLPCFRAWLQTSRCGMARNRRDVGPRELRWPVRRQAEEGKPEICEGRGCGQRVGFVCPLMRRCPVRPKNVPGKRKKKKSCVRARHGLWASRLRVGIALAAYLGTWERLPRAHFAYTPKWPKNRGVYPPLTICLVLCRKQTTRSPTQPNSLQTPH